MSVQPTCKYFPKGIGNDKVCTPPPYPCPKVISCRLFADLVNDSLTEFSYDADLAGLSYNYASHPFGTYVALSGYNDKLPLLLHHIFEKIKGLKVKPDRLNVMKEQVGVCVVFSRF